MLSSFKAWWAQPFAGSENMSVLNWFLFVGLMLVILSSWGLIFKHLKEV